MSGGDLSALDAAQEAFDRLAAVSPASSAQPWSADLVKFLSVAVLVFTGLALVLSSVLLWRQRARPAQVLKLFGVLTIVGISALLLVAGYSNEQLTPIVGLFGALAGYLLGKDTGVRTEEREPDHRS